MPSSTSSSDAAVIAIPLVVTRANVPRLTAADRPGVAQPVPERDIPVQPWRTIFIGALSLFIMLMAAWELYWRSQGAVAGYYNSNAEWAQQRRRIDAGEGGKTILVGSSRILFDVQLPVWEKATGERPIQLAIEGTSAVPVLEDLAADPNVTGRIVVGVASDLFFTGFAFRGDVVPYFHKESPSQRVGNWLSREFIEPYFAFDDFDFALGAVLKRQPWPARTDVPNRFDVRKLLVQDADRNSTLWSKLETDIEYRDLARSIWAQHFDGPPPPSMDTPEKLQKIIDTQIQRAVDAVAKLRARGVPVLFVRPPTAGRYLEFDNKVFAREHTWDLLLARTGAPGIHFADYPELQGYELPEWSHMKKAEAERFTQALVAIIGRDFWKPASD
ncbi:MAG TPA: hypothetical protein VHW73_03220 [Rudaea sp.]|jgi:hypothetical protein|nr:hypothetical protein [Rudaea sp.]